MSAPGKLLVCATPIGNLGDVTLRVLDALRTVDLVAAEDTRRTRKLMSRYDISTPLMSYHARNEKARRPQLLARLAAGDSVALVSDAGTPGIADPGHRLIAACIELEIDVDVLPGANAALTALVASGLPAEVFTFVGFLPRRAGARRKLFDEMMAAAHTFVFYESPHRVVASLEELAQVSPSSQVAVARELTKVYQEIVRGSATQAAGAARSKEPRGEYVVVVSPPAHQPAVPCSRTDIAREVVALEDLGVDRKEAMRRVAHDLNLKRRDVYDAILASEGKRKKAASED